MAQVAPNIYLLDGENDFEMANYLARIESRLGESDIAGLNTTRLDGKNLNLDELKRSCYAMPFLTELRLVVVTQPATRLNDNVSRDKFQDIIQNLPPTTVVALVHSGVLTDERDRKKNKVHWLESWFVKAGSNYSYQRFNLPRGQEMVIWIQNRVKAAGGQFTPAAATKLASLVGESPRRADQEIHKLLEYVNYSRPVEADDVDHLTPSSAAAGDFALVNALRAQNAKQAQYVLHKLLEENEPLWLFTNIVAQFRQLLLVRELLDQRLGKEEISRVLGLHPYVTGLAMEHAHHFEMVALENIYQRLHELDFKIKTGQIEGELALDLLVLELTEKSDLPIRV